MDDNENGPKSNLGTRKGTLFGLKGLVREQNQPKNGIRALSPKP